MMAAVNELLLGDMVDDDEEFLLLFDAREHRVNLPYWKYGRFNLESYEADECKTYLRFEKDEVYKLYDVLKIPPEVRCQNGSVFDGIEAFCMFLHRFAYPCRYADMVPTFGRSVPELCLATCKIVDIIYDNFHHLLETLEQPWLAPAKLQQFCNAIHTKGAPLDNCWGFIDGTVRPICRPGQSQRIMYNGHKRLHGIKFQSVVAPNGLIANLSGPYEGRRHDSGMLADSQLLLQLEEFSNGPNGNVFCLYGDPAYPLRRHLLGPYRKRAQRPLTELEEQFNKEMSAVRVSVEWAFNEVLNYFKFIDFKKNLKMNLSAVGKMYLVCALMTNAHTILYSSTTTSFFGMDPPALEYYFQ